MRIPIMIDGIVALLVVHALSLQHEGGDGSFHERHRMLLPLFAAVPSAPEHDAARSATLKRVDRRPGVVALDAGA